jgi:MoxR-like ATPase
MTATQAAPQDDVRQLEHLVAAVTRLRAQVAQRIVGQEEVVDGILTAILAGGHALLIGVPGLAKTLMVQTVAEALDLTFNRVQFTPDLMPSDITGTEIIEEDLTTGRRAFRFVKGPIFANVVLADEINRTPPKTQAALLQAMQEHQITAGGTTYRLPDPFFVLATQNPIEQEGTYPLPEAQVDRFMLKLRVGYPSLEEERRIMDTMSVTDKEFSLQPVIRPEAILRARQVVDQIYLDQKIKEYILAIIFATRQPEKYNLPLKDYIRYGASPRASIYLAVTARAHAFLNGRGYVTPQDVKSMAPDVLRHRVVASYEAEAEELTSDDLVARVLNELPVP